MEDEMEVRLEDLQLVEIQELLEENGIELGEQEITALTELVGQMGSLEEALEALSQLSSRQDAA
jgi:hypothetical protein